jgi:hypothetical protein
VVTDTSALVSESDFTVKGCPVEVPVGGLHKSRRVASVSAVRLLAKAVQRSQRTAGVILQTVPSPSAPPQNVVP